MKDSDLNPWWRGAEAALAGALFVFPWSLGGAAGWTLPLLVALSSLAALLWVVGARQFGRRWGGHVALVGPALLAVLALLQLAPLPPAVLGVLSPPAAELREFALVPLGFEGWRPISIDGPATERALARALALGGLLFVALQLGRVEVIRERLLRALALAGLTVAATGFGHLLAGEDALFGVYRFTGTTPLVTPFGNTNHLAAYLTLCSTVALGLSLDAQSRDSKVGWGLAALMMGVAVFLTMSRGGITAFVVTWAMVATLVVAARRGGSGRAMIPWLIIGATVAFSLMLAFEELAERLQTVDTLGELQHTKLELWPDFARAGWASWPLGMGAGAFELGFGRFQVAQLHETFTHPENFALQWFTELGLGGALSLAAVTFFSGRRAWAATRQHRLERVVLVGCVGVLLHDLFDFSLELNAVSVVAVIAFGLLCGVGTRSAGRAVVKTRALAVVVALIAGAGVLAWRGRSDHLEAERVLLAKLTTHPDPRALRSLALELIDRHPADWVLYSNVASFMASNGSATEALAWVNRLLFLRPADPRAHVAAGRALLRLGKRSQALLEFKTSFSLGDRTALPLALAIAAKEGDFERVLIDERGFISECHRLLVGRDRTAAAALLASAVAAGGNEALVAEARILQVAALADEDPARALDDLDKLPSAEGAKQSAVLLRLRLLAKLGRQAEGRALLQPYLTAEPGNLDLVLAMADLLEGLHRGAEARAVFVRARPFVSAPAQRIELLLREAASWEAEGRWSRALDLIQSAVRLEPARPDLHYRLGSVYEQLGSKRAAVEAVRRGIALDTLEGGQARRAWLDRLSALDPGDEPR